MSSRRRIMQTLGLVAALFAISAAPVPHADAQDKKRDIAAIENDLVADAPAVRAKAAAELADRFPEGAVAVPMLVDLLDDEAPEVVAAAARSIDALAIAATAPLAAYLLDESRWKSDPALTETLPVLLTQKVPSALNAFDPIRENRKQPMPAGEAVLVALHAHDPQHPAAYKLLPVAKSNGPAKNFAAAALAMHAADVLVARGVAPTTLPGRATAATSVLPLAKHSLDVRAWGGARLLARIRSADAPIVEALTQSLAGTKTPFMDREKALDSVSQPAACVALAALGPAAASAAPKLLELASKKDTGPVSECVDALLRMGREGDVVELLKKAPPTAESLESALAAGGRVPELVVPRLIARLEASEWLDGLFELSNYGPAAAAALPVLKKQPAEEERRTLRLADAILAISPGDADAAKMIDGLLASSDPEIAWKAREVADARLPGSAALAAKIGAILAKKEKDGPTAGDFCRALGRCASEAKAAVPAIVAEFPAVEKQLAVIGCGPRTSLIRRELCRTLGLIGSAATMALPVLTTLRDKGDETIRVPAAQALRRINAKK